MNQLRKIVLLKYNQIMQYDWGSSNKACLINQLRKQPHQKYAELWMGTHPKGHSQLTDKSNLVSYLNKIGSQGLPFLYKILCIEKALSIQIHPNKKQAQILNAQHPNIYSDNNQKPEMFLTLSQFQCLFGIISSEDLDKLFTIQPFNNLKSAKQKKIKEIITELLSFSEQNRKVCINQALVNIQKIFPQRKKLLYELQQQFPYDEGILVSCLLRYKILPPGECYAIAAGVPHAYLKGSCFQIMKNSDNVVRLGLTPKLKDVKTMLQIMNDKIGLDGIKVEKTAQGYIWNNLILKPLQIANNTTTEIKIQHQSIGIIFQGQFQCSSEDFKAEKGQVFYIQAGNYLVKGPFIVYFGGYSYKQ